VFSAGGDWPTAPAIRDLEALVEGRVVDGDPATIKGHLLQEQHEIDSELLGNVCFARREN
jgi:hypothetical protein